MLQSESAVIPRENLVSEMYQDNTKSIAALLIFVALALAAGRIAVVSDIEQNTALVSANDKSRWCTIASLVERGTYAIEEQEAVTYNDSRRKDKTVKPWRTIDKVRHTGADGELHYYSSKPPLFPTMVAGLYWIVNKATGMTLTSEPTYLVRILLAMVNLPMLALFLIATVRSIGIVCKNNWGNLLATLAVCFGTMVLPFTVALNNHLPAATCTATTMWLYLIATRRLEAQPAEKVPLWLWFLAGLSAAFAAANELPALSMLVFWGLLFLILSRASALPFIAGAAVIVVGFFGTNYLAHESWRPPYAHRGTGDLIFELESQPEELLPAVLRDELRKQDLIGEDDEIVIEQSLEQGRWPVKCNGQVYAVFHPDSSPVAGKWAVTHWDDWYDYPNTHWTPARLNGVDKGESSRAVYFLHMTIGHHGIFSLSPIWLLVPLGFVMGVRHVSKGYRLMTVASLVSSLVCIAFYISRSEIDRNYGGVSACFRWLLWFAPLWLMAASPVIEKFADRKGFQWAFAGMLAVSMFSAASSLNTPFQHPWLYRFWAFLEIFGVSGG